MNQLTRRTVVLPALLIACLMGAPASHAVDTLLLDLGTVDGDADAERYGGAVRWDFSPRWFDSGEWFLGTYLEFGITYWDGRNGTTGEDSLVDFGLTPVLRFQRDPKHGVAPFIEAGLGVHLHTDDGIQDEDFDIPFAFGSHFGAGLRMGEGGRYEVVYRYQHLSNAGLGDDNPGINYHVLQLGYHF